MFCFSVLKKMLNHNESGDGFLVIIITKMKFCKQKFTCSSYLLRGVSMCGPVAQWIRHLTTNQGFPRSNPGGVDHFCL